MRIAHAILISVHAHVHVHVRACTCACACASAVPLRSLGIKERFLNPGFKLLYERISCSVLLIHLVETVLHIKPKRLNPHLSMATEEAVMVRLSKVGLNLRIQ